MGRTRRPGDGDCSDIHLPAQPAEKIDVKGLARSLGLDRLRHGLSQVC
jgi:hypothetical protein